MLNMKNQTAFSTRLKKFSMILFLIGIIFVARGSSKMVEAAGPCTCVDDPNKSGTEGVCSADCSSSIKGTSCGERDSEGGNQFCDNKQKMHSCENTQPYTDIESPHILEDQYLCLKDPNGGNKVAKNAIKGAWSDVFKECYCSTGELIQKILNIAIYATSILTLIILAIGGIKYITSQNNPDKILEAKETLTSGLVGMILIIFCVAIIALLNNQIDPSWGVNFLNLP